METLFGKLGDLVAAKEFWQALKAKPNIWNQLKIELRPQSAKALLFMKIIRLTIKCLKNFLAAFWLENLKYIRFDPAISLYQEK